MWVLTRTASRSHLVKLGQAHMTHNPHLEGRGFKSQLELGFFFSSFSVYVKFSLMCNKSFTAIFNLHLILINVQQKFLSISAGHSRLLLTEFPEVLFLRDIMYRVRYNDRP